MRARPTIRRCARQRALSLLVLLARAARGKRRRVLGRRLPGGPAQLQHPRVRGLRHARHERSGGRATPRGLAFAACHGERRPPVDRSAAARCRWSRSMRRSARASRPSAGRGPHGAGTAAMRSSSTPTRPDIQAIPIKNVRANQRCPRAAARPGRRLPGAHVPCQRIDAHRAARHLRRTPRQRSHARRAAANFIRTYKAEVGVADALPPVAAIAADTPLARGEWVSGSQPLNYDASDNVGVRTAYALVSGQARGTHQRACAFAAPEGPYSQPVPCPNGPGQITVNTLELPDGTQPARGTGSGRRRQPRELRQRSPHGSTTRAPGRVDAGVEGGEQWRNQNNYGVTWSNPVEGDRAPITAAIYKLCPAGRRKLHPSGGRGRRNLRA